MHLRKPRKILVKMIKVVPPSVLDIRERFDPPDDIVEVFLVSAVLTSLVEAPCMEMLDL
jgi:hypothetical protein